MASLNLADTFITFLALAGPQKVLLTFAQLARTLDVRSLRLVAAATALTAAVIGTLCALTAPWLATFFHLSQAALALARLRKPRGQDRAHAASSLTALLNTSPRCA